MNARPSATSRNWVAASTLVTALLCALLGGGAVALRARSGATPATRAPVVTDPRALFRPGSLPTGFALLPLAGYPTTQLVEEALRIGEPMAAPPVLLTDPTVGAAETGALLLQIAEATEIAPADAAAVLRLATDIARISPAMSDAQRVEILVQAGLRLWALGYRDAARSEWRQAAILVRSSPALEEARLRLTGLLEAAYIEIGEPARAADLRRVATQARPGPVPLPPPPLLPTGPLPDPPESLEKAAAERRGAALAAAEAIVAGRQPDYERFSAALERESELRERWVRETLAQGVPPGQQAALLEAQIRGLLLEELVAGGLIDRDAFLRWEERRPTLDHDLALIWQTLDQVRRHQIVALPDAAEVTRAQREWLAHRLLAARLGRDPGLDLDATVAALAELNRDSAIVELRLVWRDDGAEYRPWRVPPAFVEQGLPPE